MSWDPAVPGVLRPDFRLPRDPATARAVLDGVPAAEAVAYVRAHYDPRAVETRGQARFVRGSR